MIGSKVLKYWNWDTVGLIAIGVSLLNCLRHYNDSNQSILWLILAIVLHNNIILGRKNGN